MSYYMDEYEVLDYLSRHGLIYSPSWLRKCRAQRSGIAYVKLAGKVRYREEDILAWLRNQLVFIPTMGYVKDKNLP